MSAPILSLRGLSKSYLGADGARTDVLSGVELDVQEGEFVAVLGFSGAGKTTLVSAIAGLIEADSGDILIKGRPCAGPGPARGVVFQS